MEMAAATSLSENNEQTVQVENSERLEIDELQDMLNVVRNATVSIDPNIQGESVDARPMDQALLLLNKALLLLRECDVARQAENTGGDEPISIEETSTPIADAFNSAAQHFALHLYSVVSSTSTRVGEEPVDNNDQEVETNIPSGDAVPCLQQPTDQQEPQIPITTTTGNIHQGSNKKRHIMISYNQSSFKICRRICNRLRALNCVVWMDFDDMYDDILESMARAIENSYIFLPCISRAYYESGYCKLEAEYAAEQRVKVIPCIMEPSFRAESWLGIIKGSNMHIDFSPPNDFENSFNLLVKQIRHIEAKLAQPPTAETMTDTQTTTATNDLRAMRSRFNTIIRNYKKAIKKNHVHLSKRQRNEFEQMIVEIRGNLFKNNSAENMPQNLIEANEILQRYLTASLDLNESMMRMQINTNSSNVSSRKRDKKIHVNIDGIIQMVLAIMIGWTLAIIIKKD